MAKFKKDHPCRDCIWNIKYVSKKKTNAGEIPYCWIHDYSSQCQMLTNFNTKQRERYQKHFDKKRA